MNPIREALLWASQNAMLREHLPRYRAVRMTVARFMPGEAMDDALDAARRLQADGIPTTFTRLGENVPDLGAAEAVTEHYLELLDRILEMGVDSEISVKLTQLGLDADFDACLANVERLAERSAAADRTVWIDMESTDHVAATVDLYERLVRRFPKTGICLQAYLRRTWDDVQRLLPLDPSIRLVKGAYREPKELVFQEKRSIDESYLRLAVGILERSSAGSGRLALATHDTDLIQRIERCSIIERMGIDSFEIQMLYGIRVAAQHRLAHDGHRVRTLISYGPYWYPWFMRRLAEKPSNVWFAARNLVARAPGRAS